MTDCKRRTLMAAAALAALAGGAQAAQCGNTAAGFESWKQQFAAEAQGRASPAAIAALMRTSYSTPTIAADRGQRSFKLSLGEFMNKRGASVIVSKGRQLKRTNAALFNSIEQRYGVPPGPLIAIWGMETGFGAVRGNINTLSAVATLAYDCRRSAFFTDQLYAALQLVDRGVLTSNTRGAAHGEIGHTQFLPKNVVLYGTGGDMNNVGAAMTSTANFLRGHGWRPGAGYQPGEANYAALQGWNAAGVYQQALAIMGRQIDGE